jgi:hypothetical protein
MDGSFENLAGVITGCRIFKEQLYLPILIENAI